MLSDRNTVEFFIKNFNLSLQMQIFLVYLSPYILAVKMFAKSDGI